MCGIAGFLFYNNKHLVETDLLLNMRDAMIHRGPDEFGVYQSDNVGLVHRRLSIIDLSSGKQPMLSEDKKWCIVFNGEIYNYIELKRFLESKGFVFQTSSDTEVILKLYMFEGDACVKRLRGMFAFAVWDAEHQKLFCARDHLGKKPFYYATEKEYFCFASEIKSILTIPFFKRNPDWESIDAYLTLGYVPGEHSAFSGILKLLPGHCMSIVNGCKTIKRYWDFSDVGYSDSVKSEKELVEELQELFDSAVSDRLMSEVPLGAFLSGGVDSTSVVASMAKRSTSPIKTTTIGFENKLFDESDIAARSAKFYGTEHFNYTVEPDALAIIDRIVSGYDEPLADVSSIPTYYVCQLARKNVTVSISGDGGDEMFGGYNWYFTYLKNRSFSKKIFPVNHLFATLQGIDSRLKGAAYCKAIGMDDWNALLQFRSVLNSSTRKKMYENEFYKSVVSNSVMESIKNDFTTRTQSFDILRKMQYFDLMYYLPDDILVKVDRMSMVHSLEVRAPLLDYRIAEFAWKLPSRLKINNSTGKYILKKAMAPRLPEGLLQYPKKGFTPPVKDWLLGPMKSMMQDALFSEKAKQRGIFNPKVIQKQWNSFVNNKQWTTDMSVQMWALLMLELWFKKYLD